MTADNTDTNERTYCAVTFKADDEIEKYEHVPRHEARKLGRELIEDLLDGRIKFICMAWQGKPPRV